MLIGIMSDSHGRAGAVSQALARFDSLAVGFVVHCGDVGGTEVLDQLVGRPCAFVWGNTDTPGASLRYYLQMVGLPAPPQVLPLELEFDGKRLSVFHGHERGFAEAIESGRADYVLHGHTHVPRDERVGGTRVINPGALFRAATKTVATLDVAGDELLFHKIE